MRSANFDNAHDFLDPVPGTSFTTHLSSFGSACSTMFSAISAGYTASHHYESLRASGMPHDEAIKIVLETDFASK
jgi:hypothetical protein